MTMPPPLTISPLATALTEMYLLLIPLPLKKISTPTSAIHHHPMLEMGILDEKPDYFMNPYLLRPASCFSARHPPILPEA